MWLYISKIVSMQNKQLIRHFIGHPVLYGMILTAIQKSKYSLAEKPIWQKETSKVHIWNLDFQKVNFLGIVVLLSTAL